MTRTYLKSSSSLLIKKPPDKDTKVIRNSVFSRAPYTINYLSQTKATSSVRGIQTTPVKTDWRGKPQLDDSLDSPEIGKVSFDRAVKTFNNYFSVQVKEKSQALTSPWYPQQPVFVQRQLHQHFPRFIIIEKICGVQKGSCS